MPKPSSNRAVRGVGRASAAGGFASLALAAVGGLSAAQVATMRRDEARSALRAMGPTIYAVSFEDGLVKIGHSANLVNRLHAYGINLDSLHRLLMVKSGTVYEELMLHEHFQPHLARGREYYHRAPEIVDYINAVRRQMGVRPIA